MTKYTYYVIEEHNPTTGKLYAHAEKVANMENLIYKFKPMKGFEVISVNACDTWKEAQQIADLWNESAKNKNSYAF